MFFQDNNCYLPIDLMRALFAGLFVFLVMGLVLKWISTSFPNDIPPWWVTPSMILTFFGAIVLAMIMFNDQGWRKPVPIKPLSERIADIESKGLLLRENFRATRAFSVESWEDAGPQYYVELEDGRVMFVCGQDLYEYEPMEDENYPEENQPRKFPCTEFQILQDKNKELLFWIECGGSVLEPEVEAPPFTKKDWKHGIPSNGDIIANQSYDEIKAQRVIG